MTSCPSAGKRPSVSDVPATTPIPVPTETIDWLLETDNPAVAVLTRRTVLGEPDSPATSAVWARRNQYEPVARILEAQHEDGSWDRPARDYAKYGGSLWQVHFLGELYADPADERVGRGAAYAFSRQLPDGSWSCNGKPTGVIPCLTANVARALARLGHARDERVLHAVAYLAGVYREYGLLACPLGGVSATLNGYCHMLAPKVLLLLGEVPRALWPDGTEALRDAAVAALREKEIFRSLPAGARDFAESMYTTKAADRAAVRAHYLAQHTPLVYGDKPGWLRFGFPLSYNSDALESLAALTAVGEMWRAEYAPAVDLVRRTADRDMRWTMRNSFNGRMIADVETKGRPSKWLTLRALQVLAHFGR
jgi:hypothetical protein